MVKKKGREGRARGESKEGSFKGGHMTQYSYVFFSGIPTKWIANVNTASSDVKEHLLVCQTTV